ncbi:MAG TPA: transglycosylase domain-containing protein, partial [Candidatus Gracilibacteria bacterium]|nr:transglycosylase domain-containing protein [Candidatus Gracilibacteria bacterium]
MLFRLAGVALFFIFFALSFFVYIAYLLPLPEPFSFPSDYPTTKIFDRNGQLLYEVLRPELGKNTTVPLSQMPENLINATLAAEDINFYSHPGIDAGAIARALFFNVSEGRVVSGASTITQQV